jgi:methionyl-tRNA synthetase
VTLERKASMNIKKWAEKFTKRDALQAANVQLTEASADRVLRDMLEDAYSNPKKFRARNLSVTRTTWGINIPGLADSDLRDLASMMRVPEGWSVHVHGHCLTLTLER